MICALKNDTLILADVFETFRKTYLKMYELDPVKFLSAPGLAALKRTISFKKERSKVRTINWHWYVINSWKRHKRRNL